MDHYVVNLKLIYYCKSIILQLKRKLRKIREEIHPWNKNMLLLLFFFFFFLMAASVVYGSSWVRDWIWATAVTYATAAAKPDPLTSAPVQGLNLRLHSDLSYCSWILKSLCHNVNSMLLFFKENKWLWKGPWKLTLMIYTKMSTERAEDKD